MTIKEYKENYDQEDMVGMDAIDEILYEIYKDKEATFFESNDEENDNCPLHSRAPCNTGDNTRAYSVR